MRPRSSRRAGATPRDANARRIGSATKGSSRPRALSSSRESSIATSTAVQRSTVVGVIFATELKLPKVIAPERGDRGLATTSGLKQTKQPGIRSKVSAANASPPG